MVYKDTLYKAFYMSENRTPGLTDVLLYITIPAGTKLGPYTMTEMPSSPGVYYYDYAVTTEGRYLFESDSATMPHPAGTAIDVVTSPSDSLVPIAEFDEV